MLSVCGRDKLTENYYPQFPSALQCLSIFQLFVLVLVQSQRSHQTLFSGRRQFLAEKLYKPTVHSLCSIKWQI